jgi:hypothetical protein
VVEGAPATASLAPHRYGRRVALILNPVWYLRVLGRRLTGRTGAFRNAEQSERAHHLSAAWDAAFPGMPALSYRLDGVSDRWVRFHSLPGSKRYAETPAEHDVVYRRHRLVLEQLHSAGPLTVIAADWHGDWGGGWTKTYLPGAWPWRVKPADDYTGPADFWIAEFASIEQLRPLLTAIADDIGRALITTTDVDWLYCPYDGGADIIARTPAERDAIKASHKSWLPRNKQGL